MASPRSRRTTQLWRLPCPEEVPAIAGKSTGALNPVRKLEGLQKTIIRISLFVLPVRASR